MFSENSFYLILSGVRTHWLWLVSCHSGQLGSSIDCHNRNWLCYLLACYKLWGCLSYLRGRGSDSLEQQYIV